MKNFKKEINDLINQKKYKEALDVALNWTQGDSKNVSAWSSLSYVYSMNNLDNEAETAILKALELSPSEPAFFFKLGNVKIKQKQISLALEAFEKCISRSLEIKKDYYLDSAKLYQAQCFLLLGQKKEAKLTAEQVKPETGIWFGEYITPKKILDKL